MHPNAAGQVQVAFSVVARDALEPDTFATEAIRPGSFLSRAHFAVPGDLVQLPGCQDLFIVSQRIWNLKSGTTTLQLEFYVLVRDRD